MSAERFARVHGMLSSELYATALRHYPEERRGERVTERQGEVYGAEPGNLDPVIVRLQARSLLEDDWECSVEKSRKSLRSTRRSSRSG